ncbi:MAG TPA: radical SAM protein [Candidatus Ozemobacteraceae bacterium]|nr:radical SAM protein [Candidatus Ozemobacteraceae bacterium]
MRQFGSIGSYKARIAYPPIDLLKIAGYLRTCGHEPDVLDANTLRLSWDDVCAEIRRCLPDAIGFTTSTTTILHDMELTRRARSVVPNIVTVAIGAHVRAIPCETLVSHPDLDAVVVQDAEPVFRDLAMGLTLPAVRGIWYRPAPGAAPERTQPQELPACLDVYGFTAFDKVNPAWYTDPLARRQPMTVDYGQIGCVNRCSFCMSQLYGGLRFRSPEHFLKEIRMIRDLGYREVFFIDCGFTNSHEWVRRVADGIRRYVPDLSWWCLSREDRLDTDIIDLLKASGCHAVGIGVESADPGVLRASGKKVNPNRVRFLVEKLKKRGMTVLLYFQFGLLGETRQSMQRTLDFALRSGADLATFGIATPVPGTPFYDEVRRRGYLSTTDWSRYDPNLPPVYEYPGLGSAEIFEFSRQAYRAFYLRPAYMMRRLLALRSWRDFRGNIENAVHLVSRLLGRGG